MSKAVAAEDRFEQYVQAGIARSPEPLRELGRYLADHLDEDEFQTANALILQLATNPPTATADGMVRMPDGWTIRRSGEEAFVAGPNGGGWFNRSGNLWQRTLFDLADGIHQKNVTGQEAEVRAT